MKKVIIALLVLALMLASVSVFFGCKKKEDNKEPTAPVIEKKDVFEVIAESRPATKIVTLTAIKSGNDTLEGEFITVVSGSDSRFDYAYDRYTTIEEATELGGGRIVHIEGHVINKDAYYSTDESKNWGSAAPSVEYSNLKLNLEKTKLHDVVVSEDGLSFTGKVYKENFVSVLSVDLNATVASITVTTDGNNLRSIKIEFTANNGDIVVINTSYTYDDHDVSDILK